MIVSYTSLCFDDSISCLLIFHFFSLHSLCLLSGVWLVVMDSVLDRPLLHIPPATAGTQPAAYLLCHPAGSRHDHGEVIVCPSKHSIQEILSVVFCSKTLLMVNMVNISYLPVNIIFEYVTAWKQHRYTMQILLWNYTNIFLHMQIQADSEHTVKRCIRGHSLIKPPTLHCKNYSKTFSHSSQSTLNKVKVM